MSMRVQTLAIATGFALTAGIGYMIYFDHKRRSDPSFRKKLRRERKRVEKLEKDAKANETVDLIRNVLESLKNEQLPDTPQGKEKFFMAQVTVAEESWSRGLKEDSISSFYKALVVYPQPKELLDIYKDTIPPEAYAIVKAIWDAQHNAREATAEENPLD